MRTRTWTWLGTAAVGALGFSLWAEGGHPERVRPAAAPIEGTAPQASSARWAPPPGDAPTLAQALATRPARAPREHRDAPVVGGVVQIGPVARGPGAPPAPGTQQQSSAAWASSYAVAMCDCHTRACAADLQGRFIHALGGVEHDEARDGAAYEQSIKRAVDCYVALPEGS